jgi:hypothetical protein
MNQSDSSTAAAVPHEQRVKGTDIIPTEDQAIRAMQATKVDKQKTDDQDVDSQRHPEEQNIDAKEYPQKGKQL